MKVYLSSRYSRLDELAQYREQLADLGIECTSRWLNGSTAQYTEENARIDIDDIYAADVFVRFSDAFSDYSRPSGNPRAGKQFEAGVAWETGIPGIVVGPREHVFDLLPGMLHVPGWPEALVELQELAIDQIGERILANALEPERRKRRQVVRS